LPIGRPFLRRYFKDAMTSKFPQEKTCKKMRTYRRDAKSQPMSYCPLKIA
jgi:hypothetical protein